MSGEALSAGTVSMPVKPDTKGFGAKLAEGVRAESGGLSELGSELGKHLMEGLEVIGIAVGVGEFIKKGIEEYSQADALNAQFAAGIKSTGNAADLSVKGMDELAASISGYSGQTYDSIGKTEQILQTFTNLRNVGPDKIFDEATEAAANMAAKLGGDASSSAIQLGKALNDPVKGMTALRRVGVAFTASQEAQIKASVAAGDTLSAQKVILAELNTEFGGAAKAAGETLPGEINRSKVAFGELTKAVVGGVMPFVAPAIGGIADAMNRVTPDIEKFEDLFKDKLGEAMHEFREGFKDGTDEVGSSQGIFAVFGAQTFAVFEKVREAAAPILTQIGSSLKALEPVFSPLISQVVQLWSSFSPLSLVIKALAPLFPQIASVVVQLATTLGSALGGALSTLLPVLTRLASMFSGELATVVRMLVPIVMQLVQAIGPVLMQVLNALAPVLGQLFGDFGHIVQALMPLITMVLQLVQAFLPLLTPLIQLVGTILTPLISLFGQLLTPITQLVTKIIGDLIPALQPLIQLLEAVLPPVIQALMPIIGSLGNVLSDVLGPAINAVTQILGGLIDFITGVFSGNWSQAWRGITEIFSGLWSGITGVVRGAFNGVIDIVNGAIKGIDSIGGSIGVNISTIPHLAEGGTVLPRPGGTVALLGEAGRAESVVDTGKLNKLLDRANENEAGGGIHIDVHEVTDGRQTADLIAHKLRRKKV